MSEANSSEPTQTRLVWIAIVGAMVLIGGWMARFGPEPTADDYGQYLMHAEAVLDGRAYADIPYLFSHYSWGTGPPVSAPGFALSFVPILATVGYGEWLHPVAMLLAMLALAVLTARYFGQWNREHGVAAAFVVVIGLLFMRGGSTLYPDIPFAVLCWTVILLADGAERWSWKRTIAILLAGVAAVMFRTAGIALIPAMLLFGVLSYRALRWRPLVHVVGWALTFWLVFNVFGAGRFPPTPAGYVERTGFTDLTLVQRVIENALNYRFPLFNLQLYPFPSGLLNDGYHVLMTLVVAAALFRWMAGAWYRFGVIFMAGYIAMLLLVPVQSSRYLWPMFPFIAYGMVLGLDRVLRVGPLRRLSTTARVMIPLAVLTVLTWGTRLADPPRPGLLQEESVQAVFEWVGDAAALDPYTRVIFVKPRTLSWYTGVPAMALLYPPIPDVALSEIRRGEITHVVVGTLGVQDEEADRLWREVIEEHPDVFRLELEAGDFQIYEVASADS